MLVPAEDVNKGAVKMTVSEDGMPFDRADRRIIRPSKGYIGGQETGCQRVPTTQ
jgi:hypothetical protein